MLKTGTYNLRRHAMFTTWHAAAAVGCAMVLTAALSQTASAAEYRPAPPQAIPS